jgi:hypothetical protein
MIGNYPELAARGTQLEPLVFKVIAVRSAGTRKSIRDILDFHKDDFPAAYEYLVTHIEQFEAALDDKRILELGKKPTTRAKAIADAMAGTEHGYDLRTSYEYARQGRRMKRAIHK